MAPLAALFAWPVVGLVLFHNLRLPLAVLVTLIGGYLLLPERTEIDLPVLPALDKHSVPALSVLLGLALVAGQGRRITALAGVIPKSWPVRLLLAVAVAGAFLTVLTNGDTLVYGTRVLRGLRPYDGFSEVLSMIMLLLPMLIARKYLADPESHVLILKAFVVAGLAYSLLALFEIRMSPQINRMVYGFFPHSWVQHVRGGGFRPLVFLQHGLFLAIFFSATILAAAGLSRIDKGRRGLWLVAALWLLATLTLSRSLGALLITMVLIPVLLFLGWRLQLLAAVVIAAVILTYPVARGSGVIPLDRVEAFAESIDPARAGSLRFRLDNEEILLAKAEARPLFGWGGWGRSRVYDERGRDLSITDGYWVIIIGVGGWLRYLAVFGLLTVPIFLMFRNRRRYQIGPETVVLAVILAGNLVDMIPNSGLTPLTWILGGALWGRLELGARAGDETPAEEVADAAPSRHRQTAPPRAMPQSSDIPAPEAPQSPYTRQKNRFTRTGPTSN